MRRSLPSRILGRLRQREGPPAPRLTADGLGVGETERTAPIFVIGCFRSGTSLLRRILDSHSRIACPPETKFVLPLIAVLRDQTSLRGLHSIGFERSEVVGALARFIGGFMEAYAAGQAKPRWADKTPDYVDCLPELWELFGPRARFILIIRHGLDVAFSLSDPHRHYPGIDRHVEQAGGNVPVGAGRYWAEQSEKMEAFRRERPDACFLVRYEDLTTDPPGTLKPLFDWLGEPWEPEVIDYDRFPHHAGLEDPDVRRRRKIVPNSGRYAAWPPEVQQAVRDACGSMLSALAYR